MNAPAPESPKLEACAECGMPCADGEFHPFAACLMYEACHDSVTVRSNLDYVRRLAPTASPALPEGVAADLEILRKGPRRTNLGAPDLIDWDDWAGRVYAAHDRLAAHVQSQSSTMAALEEEVERLRKALQPFANFACPEGYHPEGEAPCHNCVAAAALKPVARGENT